MALIPINQGPAVLTITPTVAGSPVQLTRLTTQNAWIFIQNISDTDMYVGWGGFTPTVTTGVFLPKLGGTLQFGSNFLPTGLFQVITSVTAVANKNIAWAFY